MPAERDIKPAAELSRGGCVVRAGRRDLRESRATIRMRNRHSAIEIASGAGDIGREVAQRRKVFSMTEEEQLQERFRSLARTVQQKASPAVEERLRVAFRARLKEKRRVWNHMAKVAALAVIGTSLYVAWADWTHRRSPEQKAAVTAPMRQRSEFIALPYGQSEVPLEQPVIVRVQIPVSELGEMGMPFAPTMGEEKVDADLLVGQDGIARAVRLAE